MTILRTRLSLGGARATVRALLSSASTTARVELACRRTRRSSGSASLGRQRGAVGPVGRHRVVGVAGEDDAGAERDLLARAARRGSRAPSQRSWAARTSGSDVGEELDRRRGSARRSAGGARSPGAPRRSSGPGLLRIASGTPSLPMSWRAARVAQGAQVGLAQLQRAADRLAALHERARVARACRQSLASSAALSASAVPS